MIVVDEIVVGHNDLVDEHNIPVITDVGVPLRRS